MCLIAQAIVGRLRSIALGRVAMRTLVSSVAMGMVEDLGIGLAVDALHVHSLLPWSLLSYSYARQLR